MPAASTIRDFSQYKTAIHIMQHAAIIQSNQSGKQQSQENQIVALHKNAIALTGKASVRQG